MVTRHGNRARLLLLALLPITFVSALDARSAPRQIEACQVSPEELRSNEPTLFDREQEAYLGEIVSTHLERTFRPIRDQALGARLRALADRLMTRMPPMGVTPRVWLVDLPYANAFALPGARIYVSRKLIALTRTEDELAGVIAHELGHVLAGHAAIEMSRAFKRVKVSSVASDEEIRETYHRIVDDYEDNPLGKLGSRDQTEQQITADRAAMLAAAGAGFDPLGFVSFWDRLAGTEGRDGNWFSDAMGTIKPAEKRLREMRDLANKLPAACLGEGATAAESFTDWKARVMFYDGLGGDARLPGLTHQTTLAPKVMPEVIGLQFSPDGRFALTHDSGGAVVTSLGPPAALFRIDELESPGIRFSSDSRFVLVYDASLRIERFDIEQRARTQIHELYVSGGCVRVQLSPDGSRLACVSLNRRDLEYGVRILDVESGEELFRKQTFYSTRHDEAERLKMIRGAAIVEMNFTPDNAFFVATLDNRVLAVDMTTLEEISLGGSVKRALRHRYTFMPGGELAGLTNDDGRVSIVSFPDGKALAELALSAQVHMAAATSGRYLILRPIPRYAVGVMNLETQKIFLANPRVPFDLHGDRFLATRSNGEVALYRIGENEPMSILPPAPGTLGQPRAVAVSQDLKWLALSSEREGGIWSVDTGERVAHTRSFRKATYDGSHRLVADFPQSGDLDRTIRSLNPANGEERNGPKLKKMLAEASQRRGLLRSGTTQHGEHLFRLTSGDGRQGFEVSRAIDGEKRWTVSLEETAPFLVATHPPERIALTRSIDSDAAKDIVKADRRLVEQQEQRAEDDGTLVQLLDSDSGRVIGSLVVSQPIWAFQTVAWGGDYVVISERAWTGERRASLFDLTTGNNEGRFFGTSPLLTPAGDRLLIETDRAEITIYETRTLAVSQELVFTSPVAFKALDQDGKTLLVLTADQSVYQIELPSND